MIEIHSDRMQESSRRRRGKNISGTINVDHWDLLRGKRHDTQLSGMKKWGNKMEEPTGYDHVYSSVYYVAANLN